MYGMIDTSRIQSPTIRPQENYGGRTPDTSVLLSGLSTLQQQSPSNPVQLAANNIGDKIASGAARGMQFIYQDVPNAAMNLLDKAKTALTPTQKPITPSRGIGGVTPQRAAELEVVSPSQRQQMNDVLNQIDRGY